jgi:hypothetical protein
MSVKEKAERIDKIMRSLDQTIIDKLPLPPGFDRLPEDKVKEARAIFADKSLDYQVGGNLPCEYTYLYIQNSK